MPDAVEIPGIAQRFAFIIRGLLQVVGTRKRPDLYPFCCWLSRLAGKFEVLAIRAQAGPLPPPRPRSAPAPSGPSNPDRPRFSQRFGWLILLVPHLAATYAGYLRQLLDEPDMAVLLLNAPQAGRLLRPLCRMLAIELPEMLQLPPRPPRPPRPKPAPDPDKLLARRARWPNGTLKRPGPPEPGVVWKKWRGIWMPEPVRPLKPA